MRGMGNEDNVLRFVIVGRSDDGTVTIGVAPARADSRVSISVGPHAANVGAQLGLTDVLDESLTRLRPGHRDEFDQARCNWVVPHLVRLAEGKDVKERKLVAAYEKRHGYEPDIEVQTRFGA
jgi:hypothetical protein